MQLVDSIATLCQAEKNGGAMLAEWTGLAVGSYEDAQTYLSQVIARADNPVIAMLAKQALGAR